MSLDDPFLLSPEDSPGSLSGNLSRGSGTSSGAQQRVVEVWWPGVGIAGVYGLLILVGLVGNLTLLRTCLLVKSLRTVPNLFLCSLAAGDLLLLLACAPVDASRYLLDRWLFGRLGCKLIPFVQLTSVGVSVFTLTTLAADRYKAIVKPLDAHQSSGSLGVGVRVGLIWLLSVALSVPEAVFSDLHAFTNSLTNETFVTCAPYPHAGELHPKIHSTASFLTFYVIPLFIISIYYCFIAHSLVKSSSDLPAEGRLHIQRQIKSRKRLARTVLVFVVLFAVCWLPSHVIYLYRSFHYAQVDTSLAHFIASVLARILAFTNSCVNPFALYLMSKSFSKHFNRQLLFCLPSRQLHTQSSGTTNVTTV